MKEEKFKVIQKVREFIIYVDKDLENFPRKYYEIKTKIRQDSYEILEILYEANITYDKEERKRLLQKVVAKIKTIDFLIDFSREKELISNKKFLKIGLRLDDISRFITGWYKTINSGA